MKLLDLAAHLVPLLNLKLSDITELLRALKEGSDHFDPLAVDKEVRKVLDEALTAALVNARPGPGGGLPADPFRVAFLITAIMLGKPRKDIALATWKAWHLHQEGSVYAGWGENWSPTITYCPLSGAALFGDAFKRILADVGLANRVQEVRLSEGAALIRFDEGKVSRFVDAGRRGHLVRETVLDGYAVHHIAQLLG